MPDDDKAETVFPPKLKPAAPAPLFEVRGLVGRGVNVAHLRIGAGEIVGLIGLVGSGCSEIARAIVGADPAHGEVMLTSSEIEELLGLARRAYPVSIGAQARYLTRWFAVDVAS